MLSVAEALARILVGVTPTAAESVGLDDAHERVLAEDIAARLTQPPFDASAMDGYAVRSADLAALPARLKLIGESAAGHAFAGALGPGQAVRIFTGAPVPQGADHIVIQENAAPHEGEVEIRETNSESFIRERGGDFSEGQVLLRRGRRLTARDLLLAAQMNHTALPVRRRPAVAILASGDELVPPGTTPSADQIISSIPTGLGLMLRRVGAEPRRLGIARDTEADLAAHIAAADDADILVTIGGASVGDHDLVRAALEAAGFSIAFQKIAMRPGKPVMSGVRGGQRVIGMPGNPVSAMLCSIIFLLPLVAALLGEEQPPASEMRYPLAAPLPENGPRQHYMRGKLRSVDGAAAVEALPSQDSSLTAALAAADCLIVRAPHAPAAAAGESVTVIPLIF